MADLHEVLELMRSQTVRAPNQRLDQIRASGAVASSTYLLRWRLHDQRRDPVTSGQVHHREVA